MIRITIVALLLTVASLAGAGCTAASETVHGIRGADYEFKPVQPIDRSLGEYRRFELAPFTDDTGGRTPREFFEYLPGAFQTALYKWKLPNESGGRALLIRGKVLHFESQSTGAMLVDPMEEVLARVELVDRRSGKVLGVANCIGRSKARVTMGTKNLAEGMGRAIADWIDSAYPKGGRE